MARSAFYDQIPICTVFADACDDRYYRAAPVDHLVVISDVIDSTGAITAGRYKEVNTIGAATIASAQNALSGEEVPAVFGGDGASLLIAPQQRDRVAAALAGLQQLARQRFGLELRVGAVPVAELRDQGAAVEVGRLQLAPGRAIAMFRGGGLSLADRLIKADPERWRLADTVGEADLAGLSCRWQAIPAERGSIVSLLVTAQGSQPQAVYAAVLRAIEDVFEGHSDLGNPVRPRAMRYRSLRECLRDELRYHRRRWTPSCLLRCAEIVIAVAIFRCSLPGLVFDARYYARAMARHADYRKFDDTLRMVLDCTSEERSAIEALLADVHRRGELCYGLHESSHALMTCFVQRPLDGEHVHFVDGDQGGYAMAARQLKAQLQAHEA